MAARKNKYQSVNLTRFFMKTVGFWRADTKFEQRLMNIALSYAILAIIFAIAVEGVDLYFCLGDFYAVTYNLCGTMLLVLIFVKLSSFLYYRDLVLDLITYAEKNFWEIEYDEYGENVLRDCDRRGVILIYSFTFIVQVATFNYILAPVIENRGRNGTDRLLPFKLWVNLPVTTTPYYEITYTVQSLSTVHSGICTFCFDNFLCCFNIHVAGQLKILSHKFEVVADRYLEIAEKNGDLGKAARSACEAFANCVRDHLRLINYVERMECAFTWILLGQLLLSSMVICFGGFQLLAAKTIVRKCIFALHFTGSISQLFLYTWTCNDITYQSEGISKSAYNMIWYSLPHDKYGKTIKHGMIMVMNRLRNPCVLTAGKFAPMSLETFTSILSTAASYFTLLQQMSEESV